MPSVTEQLPDLGGRQAGRTPFDGEQVQSLLGRGEELAEHEQGGEQSGRRRLPVLRTRYGVKSQPSPRYGGSPGRPQMDTLIQAQRTSADSGRLQSIHATISVINQLTGLHL